MQKELFQNTKESYNTFYLVRFLNSKGEIYFSKVGTTTKAIQTRLKQELYYYNKSEKLGRVSDCIIDKIYDCKDIPCEGVESYFRSLYIAKYGKSFCKNDRFFGIEFDLETADKMFNNFMAMTEN